MISQKTKKNWYTYLPLNGKPYRAMVRPVLKHSLANVPSVSNQVPPIKPHAAITAAMQRLRRASFQKISSDIIFHTAC